MASEKTVAQVLSEAADIVERGWCQDWFAADADGHAIEFLLADMEIALDPRAASVCAVGAIAKAAAAAVQGSSRVLAHEQLVDMACDALAPIAGGNVPDWNDAPERTKAEVVDALREAARRAEQEASHGE